MIESNLVKAPLPAFNQCIVSVMCFPIFTEEANGRRKEFNFCAVFQKIHLRVQSHLVVVSYLFNVNVQINMIEIPDAFDEKVPGIHCAAELLLVGSECQLCQHLRAIADF